MEQQTVGPELLAAERLVTAFDFRLLRALGCIRELRLPSVQTLDELIYQNVVFGFLLLSVGIITGSVWANSAWGSYWSWDPKETWSLITWLVYAFMLHSRLIRGWHGRKIAWVSIIGFGCVLFTYFGVNFLLSGLHSYAQS